MEGYFDALTLASEVKKVLDHGYVKLVDCMPRIVPKDRTPEFRIVQGARVSFGLDLKTPQEDARLVRRLMRDRHTSPFEGVKFTFLICCPKFVAIHFLRHRTANVNEFSQRYSEVNVERLFGSASKEEEKVLVQGRPGNIMEEMTYNTEEIDELFYHPSYVEDGVRMQSKSNKQGSAPEKPSDEAMEEVRKAEQLLTLCYRQYKRMIKAGISKEIARFVLPLACYTKFYWSIDLHNFLHFSELRLDNAAQKEIRVYAQAMIDLVKPLIPVTHEAFFNYRFNALHLSKSEVDAIKNCKPPEGATDLERKEFLVKLEALGIDSD